jgi:hypothetical protein
MKLSEIKTVNEFMEMLNWDLDENGLTITDWNRLANTVANTFDDLEVDIELTEEDEYN